MTNINIDPRDPKKLPDPVSGVENNEQVTNSEEQHLIDDVVAGTSQSSNNQTKEEQTMTEKEKRDITDIN